MGEVGRQGRVRQKAEKLFEKPAIFRVFISSVLSENDNYEVKNMKRKPKQMGTVELNYDDHLYIAEPKEYDQYFEQISLKSSEHYFLIVDLI